MNAVWPIFKHKFLHLLEQFLPAQCLICQLSSHNQLICVHCRQALLQPRSCCQYCGLSLPTPADFCGDCIKQTHLFSRLHALASYHSPYPKLIKQLKYEKRLIAGELLGQLLALSLAQHFNEQEIKRFDYLLAIPLHHKKLRQRGFNQAQLIANVVSAQLTIPLLPESVQRDKDTQPQEGLSRAKRRANLRAAFSVNKNSLLQGKHIAVLDDVVTTGATINSLCQCLLAENVASITVFCICRTGADC